MKNFIIKSQEILPLHLYICHQVLIQLGDILDRGDDEIAILSLLKSLDIQAKANGGAVFQVFVLIFFVCSCPLVLG